MSKSLYRRFRPLKLSDVIGQDQVVHPLIKSLEAKKISHAYLFIGPRGTGKTSVARIFAHEINGFKYELEDEYVDIIEIDGASNRGIDNIRELREKASIAPTSGKYKVYIIDEVHMLTKEAFNALLKTLEEPPKHVIFIMATTDAYKVPVTITSRAQTYTFKLADKTTMLKFLKEVSLVEKIKIEDAALDLITSRGGGSFRDSLSLLDQISTLSSDMITKDLVVSAMGLPSDVLIKKLLDEYVNGDVVKITAVLKELLISGIKPETLGEELIRYIIENPRPEYFPLLEKLPEVRDPFAEAKLLVAFCNQTINPISSESILKFSSTSYAGTRAEPSLRDEPVRSGRNIGVENLNKEKTQKKQDLIASSANQTINKDEFLQQIKEKTNDVIYERLKKSSIEINGNVVEIYPNTKSSELVLSSDKNASLIKSLNPNLKINIHKVNEKPKSASNDKFLDKISDIMGGEVKKDGGKNPFE